MQVCLWQFFVITKVNYLIIMSLEMTLHIIVMHIYMYILYKAMTWLRK